MFFRRQPKALGTYHQLFPSLLRSGEVPLPRHEIYEFEGLLSYLEDRIQYWGRRRGLRDHENQLRELVRAVPPERLADEIGAQELIKLIGLCIDDSLNEFRLKDKEAWFDVLFGRSGEVGKEMASLVSTSNIWRFDDRQWGRLDQLLDQFLNCQWE